MVGFISTVVISIAAAVIAYTLAGDKLLNGIWGAIPAGILGAWIGGYMPAFSGFGPTIDNVAVIPSIIGSAALIALLGFFRKAVANMAS